MEALVTTSKEINSGKEKPEEGKRKDSVDRWNSSFKETGKIDKTTKYMRLNKNFTNLNCSIFFIFDQWEPLEKLPAALQKWNAQNPCKS